MFKGARRIVTLGLWAQPAVMSESVYLYGVFIFVSLKIHVLALYPILITILINHPIQIISDKK